MYSYTIFVIVVIFVESKVLVDIFNIRSRLVGSRISFLVCFVVSRVSFRVIDAQISVKYRGSLLVPITASEVMLIIDGGVFGDAVIH